MFQNIARTVPSTDALPDPQGLPQLQLHDPKEHHLQRGLPAPAHLEARLRERLRLHGPLHVLHHVQDPESLPRSSGREEEA
jgi:hypothetical protein